jgi:hypothetical protein
MQLSDAEQKMVARLRKRKQTFARWRWALLFTGIFSMGIGIYCFVILLRMFQLDSTAAAWAAFFAPVAYLFLIIGTWIAADTLMSWHGKPEVDLLLRLMEDSQNDA